MSNKLYNDADISDIADAIRSKNGSSTTYKVSEMAQAILDIPTGGGSTGINKVCIEGSSVAYNIPTSYLSGVTKIKNYAWYNDQQISEIDLPSGVISIGQYAFANSTLQTLECNATVPPTCYQNAFSGLDNTFRVYVPDNSLTAYRQSSGWQAIHQQILPLSEKP